MSVKTQSCVLPLHHRIPASLSARLGRGREVSYSDHEAVLAILRLEEDVRVGGDGGATGDPGDHSSDHTLTQAQYSTLTGSDIG